jgi:aspartate-semialdehyde dehydrogenase
LASPRSAGQSITWRNESWTIQAVSADAFEGVDISFFSAGATRSREYAPIAMAKGAVVIDNSSAFRMDQKVPLCVPEINGEMLSPDSKLISVPNCTAIITLMGVAPLRQLGSIERLIMSTYQSASGAGAAAMEELKTQTTAVLRGETPEPKVFPHPCAFNLFSHNTPIDADGANEEEAKVVQECRKILGQDDLRINVTCVRVPVLRAHSISVTIEFAETAPSVESVREVLSRAPGVRVVDDRVNNHFPMPIEASGGNDVLVGRIRKDPSNPRGIQMFLSGDQLRKGAAQNAVQIAETLIQQGILN